MALINENSIVKLVEEALKHELNETLEQATEDVINKLKVKVKERVAAKMIAAAGSEYNLQYMRGELMVRVKID